MRLEAPLLNLALWHVANVGYTLGIDTRFTVYSVPGGITPAIVCTYPTDEGIRFVVFLSQHPTRLLKELLYLTPDEIISHYEPIEVCDALLSGVVEHDGTYHTERVEFANERGKSDLLLAANVLKARKTKRLAIGEAAN